MVGRGFKTKGSFNLIYWGWLVCQLVLRSSFWSKTVTIERIVGRETTTSIHSYLFPFKNCVDSKPQPYFISFFKSWAIGQWLVDLRGWSYQSTTFLIVISVQGNEVGTKSYECHRYTGSIYVINAIFEFLALIERRKI